MNIAQKLQERLQFLGRSQAANVAVRVATFLT